MYSEFTNAFSIQSLRRWRATPSGWTDCRALKPILSFVAISAAISDFSQPGSPWSNVLSCFSTSAHAPSSPAGAATRSITLLRASLGLAFMSLRLLSSISFSRCRCRDIWRDRIRPPCPRSASGQVDFVGDQPLVDRQAELVSRADFRGETEGV
jgi:hypothetical protein